MAGSNPAFSPTAFRTAIRSAMVMGQPNKVSDRVTFRWSTQHLYETADPANRPYNWSNTPEVVSSRPDVQVPVAVEFVARPAASRETSVGEFDEARVILTVLDEDYAKIEGADQFLLGDNTYEINFIAPPEGLFQVTVYRIFAVARDEA